ncbi:MULTISPECIES: hypothetical protein [Sphingobacterium]|uniref:hypothetical protein n=1 Tax=Sphingobacterium TaxID=28453 RepID=UPI0011C3E8AA|nr:MULTISPECIES: hypothetical protein [Sphingobacterium]QIH34695.1 hypothetical protein G6053_18145 [Sphingobacterium sp. DR205]
MNNPIVRWNRRDSTCIFRIKKINCKMENELQVNEATIFEGYTVFELFADEPIFGDLEDDKCWIGSL